MSKKILTVLLIIFAVANLNSAVKKVHLIGDSTMADYDENTTDKRGWGMMFQQFFMSDISINNRAKSGASSKSFYKEAPYWETVKTQIEEGDYVLIQFGHNDEKNGGLDGDTVRAYTDPNADYRGTTAQGTYKDYLRKYIDETRALGATPFLATPMCRKYFSGGAITRKGRHDLGENFSLPESDHTHDYAFAMREVAEELDVPLIDLTTKTKELFEDYGDAAATDLLFTSDDSTHPNALGATLVARLCAQDMTAQNILAEYINSSADMLINPVNHDFGNAYSGQTLKKEFTISGFDLEPADGSVALSVSEGFQISKDKDGPFSSSISLDYANGNIDFTRFYVTVTSSAAGGKQGTLTATNGTVNKTINLSANFIELSGGTEVKAFWELMSNADYELTGPAAVVEESWSEMYAQRYAQPNSNTLTESDKWDISRKMQRNLIEGDAWPAGDIDEVSTRYVQFGIAASQGTELNIDSIGLFVAGAGGNGMRCRISYSTNNFSDYTVIKEFQSMVANTVYEVSFIPVEKLAFGDSLLVRVYPWYGGAATGKTICIADVCIHGIASNVTNVSGKPENAIQFSTTNEGIVIQNAPAKSTVEMYDLFGRKVFHSNFSSANLIRIDKPDAPGIYICKVTSGNVRCTQKIIIN